MRASSEILVQISSPLGCIVLERVSVASRAHDAAGYNFTLGPSLSNEGLSSHGAEFDGPGTRVFYLAADSEDDRAAWTDALMTARCNADTPAFACVCVCGAPGFFVRVFVCVCVSVCVCLYPGSGMTKAATSICAACCWRSTHGTRRFAEPR